jgi:hypothetical protein
MSSSVGSPTTQKGPVEGGGGRNLANHVGKAVRSGVDTTGTGLRSPDTAWDAFLLSPLQNRMSHAKNRTTSSRHEYRVAFKKLPRWAANESKFFSASAGAWVPARHSWLQSRPLGPLLTDYLGSGRLWYHFAPELEFLHFGTTSEVLDHLSSGWPMANRQLSNVRVSCFLLCVQTCLQKWHNAYWGLRNNVIVVLGSTWASTEVFGDLLPRNRVKNVAWFQPPPDGGSHEPFLTFIPSKFRFHVEGLLDCWKIQARLL